MSRIGTWWNATRPFAFPTSVIPALLGGIVAVVHEGVHLNVLDYLLAAIGAACFHATSNLLNDYFDFRKGVDRFDTKGASRGMLVCRGMTTRAVLTEAIVLGTVSAFFAAYFLLRVGPALIPVIALGFLLGAGYTSAPTALKYRALGDVSVFLAFGVGITVGGYAVQTGRLAWTPVFYSLPVGLLIWAILHANNLRDLESDRQASITTLAMLLGAQRSRVLYMALLGLAYCSLIVMVIAGLIVPAALLPLLSLPLAIAAIRQMQVGAEISSEPVGSASAAHPRRGGLITLDMRTAQLEMAFGLLLILGLLGQAVL